MSADKPHTIAMFAKRKQQREPIVMITAYDYPSARRCDLAGVDAILVGDSLGMVVQGRSSTLGVSLDQMIYHTEMVTRAVKRAFVIGDMPFGSFQVSVEETTRAALRFLAEGGAHAVKLEGGVVVADRIAALVGFGIPVLAHIGLTPQSFHQLGGFKPQRDEERLLSDARAVQQAGAFAVVLECVPAALAVRVTEALEIPTIGIGCGAGCSGQVLVLHDLTGFNADHEGYLPRFVKRYDSLGDRMQAAVAQYVLEVRQKAFPGAEHEY